MRTTTMPDSGVLPEPHPNLVGPLDIPSQFADATLDQIPNDTLRTQVRDYGRNFWALATAGMAPVWLGPPATYKSYSAAVLCKAMHANAVRSVWVQVPVALTELERKRYSEVADRRIAQWKQAPFLVLDDFAMVRRESWQHDALVEVAVTRFDAKKPTLWTGNVFYEPGVTPSMREILEQVVGTQLARRMLERSEGFRCYVGG